MVRLLEVSEQPQFRILVPDGSVYDLDMIGFFTREVRVEQLTGSRPVQMMCNELLIQSDRSGPASDRNRLLSWLNRFNRNSLVLSAGEER